MKRPQEMNAEGDQILCQEVKVFEETQKDEVEYHAGRKDLLRFLPLAVPSLCDRVSEDPVDDDRGDHDENIDGLAPAVEEQGDDQKHEIAPAHRHKKINCQNDRQIGIQKCQA